MARFEVDEGDEGHARGHVHETEQLRFGRYGAENDVVLDALTVSGRHAVIVEEGESFSIRDQESLVGTIVNGAMLEGSRLLLSGDEVIIGPFRVRVACARSGVFRASIERIPELTPTPRAHPTPVSRTGTRRERFLARTALAGFVGTAGLVGLFVVGFGPELLSPGDRVAAHRTGDAAPKSCSDCHAPFSGPDDRRCLACHERNGVARRHDEKAETTMTCVRCHVEHSGEPAGLASTRNRSCESGDCHGTEHVVVESPVGELRFVEFGVLEFSHADHLRPEDELYCSKCHFRDGEVATAKFDDCIGCHESWAVTGHGRDAYCEDCHYTETRGDGSGRVEDHDPLPEACRKCHSPDILFAFEPPTKENMRIQKFEHESRGHARTDCETCHLAVREMTQLLDVVNVDPASDTCLTCHGDPNGLDCERCHFFHDPPH